MNNAKVNQKSDEQQGDDDRQMDMNDEPPVNSS